MSPRPPDDDRMRVDPPGRRDSGSGPGGGAPSRIGPYRLMEMLGSGGMGRCTWPSSLSRCSGKGVASSYRASRRPAQDFHFRPFADGRFGHGEHLLR